MVENSHHPYSTWDLRSSRVWQCFHTLSVKIVLVLWYFKKSFSALANQSPNDWSKLHLARQLLLLFCFLFLDSMTYPCLTLSQSSLVFCECISLSSNQKSPDQDNGGRWQAIDKLYWVVAIPFLNCPFCSLNSQPSKLATRTTADPSVLRSPKDRIWREIYAMYVMSEVVSWWPHLKTLALPPGIQLGTIQQTLIRHPLCTRPCDTCWKYKDG